MYKHTKVTCQCVDTHSIFIILKKNIKILKDSMFLFWKENVVQSSFQSRIRSCDRLTSHLVTRTFVDLLTGKACRCADVEPYRGATSSDLKSMKHLSFKLISVMLKVYQS